ncbi:hypothetical protein [Bacillus altitudinis]|uniref:hypothetical protein n=1 Tax=Bacillus altitudinis TaxID=293387 RepID=UPI0015F260DA|nr:hypothetical protein [Bacillus altitudinis]MBR0629916.1 hypothetical protein [Bacillus altitudinis S70-5-12]MCY7714139.1 hypothetical protein [Bacillus altitudinis]MED0683510.1 hypothetical protein [Bacillus altitudinis]QRF84676.1 hypothetical protein JNE42_06270 [Bacillus altitudinis]
MYWVITFIFGLVTTVINSFVLKLFNRKEYKNRVEIANSELNKTLKNFISEAGEIPNVFLIETLCVAYSKSYKIKKGDMNNVQNVVDLLIKEVFETSFLSSSQKSKISNELLELKETYLKIDQTTNLITSASFREKNSVSKMFGWAIISFITFYIVLCICAIFNIIFKIFDRNESNYELNLVTTSGVITVLLMWTLLYIQRRKK